MLLTTNEIFTGYLQQGFNALSLDNPSLATRSRSPTTTKVQVLIEKPETVLKNHLRTYCLFPHEICDLTSQYLQGYIDDELKRLLDVCKYDITKLAPDDHASLLTLASEVQRVSIFSLLPICFTKAIFKIITPSSLRIHIDSPCLDSRLAEILQDVSRSLTTLDIVRPINKNNTKCNISLLIDSFETHIPQIEVINTKNCSYYIEERLVPDYNIHVANKRCFANLHHLRELNGLTIAFVEGFRDFAICPKLQKLQFHLGYWMEFNTELTEFKTPIDCFPELTELTIIVSWYDCELTLWLLQSLVGTPKLTTLTLSNNAEDGNTLSQLMLSPEFFSTFLKFLAGGSELRDGLVKVNPALKIIKLGVLRDSAEVSEKVATLTEALSAQNVILEVIWSKT